ncbi:MAG: sporulation protein YabP [Syntrophomonadaceae bacterium]
MAEHSLTMDNRQKLHLSGITNVIAFDEEEIVLETSQGYLFINGADMHITMLNLDQGQVAIQGNINNLGYKAQGTDLKTKGKNVLNRLLK